jgi:methylenetetrahydrofolate dehydrogenase (NADP+) / methenyltetrahydrofolate cyclohydrolase
MDMRLIKGKIIASHILAKMYKDVRKKKNNPGLAVVRIGDDQASKIYIGLKRKAAEKIGMKFYLYRFSEKNETGDVINKIKLLNQNKNVQGIIVQLPLPKKFNTQKIINSIDWKKDADGFHPKNLKLFFAKKEFIWPVFPLAIIKMIKSVPGNKKIKNAVILSRSEFFGKVMVEALNRKNIKSNVALIKGNKSIKDMKASDMQGLKKVDLIVTAAGIPKFIKGNMIKKGAVIIDGGINKVGKKVFGDVDIESVKKIAGAVSPVPGGVGPVTVATLIENVTQLAKRKK